MNVSKITQAGLYPGISRQASQVGQSSQTDDFSQIFAAQSSQTETKSEPTKEVKMKESSKTEEAAARKTTDEQETNTESVEENTDVEESTDVEENTDVEESTEVEQADKTGAVEEVVEPDMEAMESAIQEIMAAIQQVLGVTNEELKSALQELGISEEDLLNTEVIPEIVVALTEGADELSVMTNEEVFANVQELTAKVEDVLKDLSDELNMKPEEMKETLQNMFEVETSASEEGSVQTVGTETKETAQTKNENQNTDNAAGQQMTFAQTVAERIEQAVTRMDATYTQTTTESIMNQVEEVIKVIQKENLTEMELQLHPASLGNVRVALAAKEGVITATFTAENEAVKAALESQMVTLKQNFESQGIKVEAVEVTVASHAFERNLSGENNGNTGEEASSGKKKGNRRITLSDLLNDVEEELSDEDRIVAEMMKQNGNTVDYTV